MTPITDAELTIWQRQAWDLLGRLLVRQGNEKLPPIIWTVVPTRELHGQCGYGDDPGAEFGAWRAALGEPDEKRMMREAGSTRWTAVWESWEGVRVVLKATVWGETESSGE